jgi:three-Cys-motif partner protein
MINADYLEAVTDGLVTRPSGSWVAEKLDYVQRYINIFETSMKSKWSQRNYIDIFAGPGKNILKDTGEVLLGSPLLSLKTKYPFTGYYFADLSLDNAHALEQRCAASPLSNLVHIYNENANRIVSTVVASIRQFFTHSLNLAFLDPEGLELEWSTVAQLGNLRCDLIIHYSQQGLSRFLPNAYESNQETSVDRFFGTEDWRNIYAPWHNKPRKIGMHRELIDLYKDRLKSLGYQEVKQSDEIITEPLIRNTRRNAPLYRLIFASKHPLGDEFWQKITKRDRYGQKQMF